MIFGSGPLLNLLGAKGGASTQAVRASEGSAGAFEALLEKARGGEIPSGRDVTIGKRAGVELSEDQLRRLSIAADRAEAEGATRALVMMDGMALRLDITLREVTEVVDLSKAGVMTGIDAFVRIADVNGEKQAPEEQRSSTLTKLAIPNLVVDPRS